MASFLRSLDFLNCFCALPLLFACFQTSEIPILVPEYLALEGSVCCVPTRASLDCIAVSFVFRLEDGSPIMIIPAGRLRKFAYAAYGISFRFFSPFFIKKQPPGAFKISAGNSCWIPRSGRSHRQPSHSHHFDHVRHVSIFWTHHGCTCLVMFVPSSLYCE